MKKIITSLFLVLFVMSIGTGFASASSCALHDGKTKIYNLGFHDARNGKAADSKYKDNDAYADGYSAGVKSVMVPDELV